MEIRRLMAGNALGGEWLGINAGREATATAIAPLSTLARPLMS